MYLAVNVTLQANAQSYARHWNFLSKDQSIFPLKRKYYKKNVINIEIEIKN